MANNETVCAATICPYLGVNDGSVWTGARDDPCETSCGWWQDGGCIAATDLAFDILRSYDGDVDEIERMDPPPCQYEDNCQWQQQCDGTCPPRLAVMTNQEEYLGMFDNE